MSELMMWLQTPTTSLAVIAAIIIATIMTLPKAGSVWLDWDKWRSAKKQMQNCTTGSESSVVLTRRSPIGEIVIGVVDIVIGVASLALLAAHIGDASPLSTGNAAFLVMLGVMAAVSLLRPLR